MPGDPLRSGQRAIGFVALHYPPGQLPAGKLPLFQAIADVLAAAVIAILVNEQVAQLQRLLLAPDPAVTPLRTRAYVSQTVIAAFRQLLLFEASFLVGYESIKTEWIELGDFYFTGSLRSARRCPAAQ